MKKLLTVLVLLSFSFSVFSMEVEEFSQDSTISFFIKNPSLGGGIGITASSDENGVCRSLGYERAAKGALKMKNDYDQKVIIDKSGDIVGGDNGHLKKIESLICLNQVFDSQLQNTKLVRPKHPESRVYFSSQSDEDGVCRVLGHKRSAKGSAKIVNDYTQKVIVNKFGEVTGGDQGYFKRIQSLVCITND